MIFDIIYKGVKMFYPTKKILTILISISILSVTAYGQNSLNHIDKMIKEKSTILSNTPKSHTTQYMSTYDDIAKLTISKNKLLMKVDKIDTDKTCDFALEYQEVEFIKTEYYKTPFNDNVADTLQNLASLFEQCHPPMAEKYLQSILKIKEHIYLKESAEVAKAHDMLGDHYRFSMANFKKSIKEYDEAKTIRVKLYGTKDPKITENYERLAFSLYYHGDKTSKAEKLLLDSINIREKAFPNIDFPLYRAYMDAGFYYSLKGEDTKHLDYYKKAKKTFSGDKKSDYKIILRELSTSP